MTDRYRDLADQLAEVGRAAVARGLVVASGGNLSARCPDRDAFVVTGTGTWLDRLVPDDFALVGLDGAVVDGAEPSSEWRLHRATYSGPPGRLAPSSTCTRRPRSSSTPSATRSGVLTLDHATYLRRIERVPYFPNGSDELADASAEASRDCDVIVLANHGCSTLGATVEMAWRRALNLEEAAMNTFRCLQLGDTTTTFPADQLGTVHHR